MGMIFNSLLGLDEAASLNYKVSDYEFSSSLYLQPPAKMSKATLVEDEEIT